MEKRKTLIKKAYKKAVDSFKDYGLKSLFYAGNEDVTENSDIDLFGIVSPEFDIEKYENKMNSHYDKERFSEYGGLEVRFRGIGEDELNGGKPRGTLAKYVGLGELIPQFDFYEHLWGEKQDFSKYAIKPPTQKEQVENYSKRIIDFLDNLKNGKQIYPIQNFPKDILRLARVEAEKDYGMKYNPSYKRIAKYLENNKGHIAHKAMDLRRKQITEEMILDLEEPVRSYVSKMKEKFQ